MISITKSGKLFFIILIIIISFSFGIKKTGLISKKRINPKKNNKFLDLFNNEANKNKTKILISAADIKDNYNKILEKVSDLNGKLILKNYNPNEFSLIFTIPDTLNNEFSKFISNYNIIHEESFFTKQNDMEINTEQRIANNKMILKKLENQLELRNLTETSISRINKQFNRIQSQIDSLQYLGKRQKAFLHSRLFWISSQSSPQKSDKIGFKIINFVLYSTISMIILFVLFFILVYLVNFILTLMDKAGIKTTRLSSSYGPKYSHEKKIKRIYKKNEDTK